MIPGTWSLFSLALLTAAPLEAPPDPIPGFLNSTSAPLSIDLRWGAHGHELAARLAATHLPADVPEFFRDAAAQLEYLNPEPDRWRDSDAREMHEGFRYDHYLDLELVPEEAFDARDRWEFLRVLYAAGIERPERDVGLLPFRVAELYQRMENGFRRWRAESDPEVRRWIEERIVNDAGILGHYVTDASQPHHTTIHFNGWNEELEENPGGFTTDRGFHSRFETQFVSAHVTAEHVFTGFSAKAARVEDPLEGIWDFVRYINGYVHRLYELDRDYGFEPDEPAHPESLAFAVERIQDGGAFLRDLWWSAWVASGEEREGG